jgi:hypothetical protein
MEGVGGLGGKNSHCRVCVWYHSKERVDAVRMVPLPPGHCRYLSNSHPVGYRVLGLALGSSLGTRHPPNSHHTATTTPVFGTIRKSTSTRFRPYHCHPATATPQAIRTSCIAVCLVLRSAHPRSPDMHPSANSHHPAATQPLPHPCLVPFERAHQRGSNDTTTNQPLPVFKPHEPRASPCAWS